MGPQEEQVPEQEKGLAATIGAGAFDSSFFHHRGQGVSMSLTGCIDMIQVIERLNRGLRAVGWQREGLPQSLRIQLCEIRKKLLPQYRFDPFMVIQKLAPAGRTLKLLRAYLDGA